MRLVGWTAAKVRHEAQRLRITAQAQKRRKWLVDIDKLIATQIKSDAEDDVLSRCATLDLTRNHYHQKDVEWLTAHLKERGFVTRWESYNGGHQEDLIIYWIPPPPSNEEK